jgi:hypothetical protein
MKSTSEALRASVPSGDSQMNRMATAGGRSQGGTLSALGMGKMLDAMNAGVAQVANRKNADLRNVGNRTNEDRAAAKSTAENTKTIAERMRRMVDILERRDADAPAAVWA